ncbi:zincin-like metallopeptidase domain-containing protein [Enterobacter asburiae]|uniref:zincin-like metallopeptidase domain-containing protein n=1 Tax=Enterobacter asburiae TaxID=61645 RepID=UPI00068A43F0|nr:zincin-like metallopeptidase domain-containing protein [Enterobacter asburiae]
MMERVRSAFYRPAADETVLSARFRFKKADNFYATTLHELVHWAGAAHRLNLIHPIRFESEEYAFKELIAELDCAFLIADLGVTGEMQHERYHAPWLISCILFVINVEFHLNNRPAARCIDPLRAAGKLILQHPTFSSINCV